MSTDTERLVADLAYVERLIAKHTELAVMRFQIAVQEGHVSIEVHGSHHEAHAWRHAIDGKVYPSHIDVRGVRHQWVVGGRIAVQVVEYPALRGDAS